MWRSVSKFGKYQRFARKNKIKYKNHPSILTILQEQFGKSFSFRIILKEDIEKKFFSLNDTKESEQLGIPTKMIKINVDICCEILYSEFNKAIELSQFSSCIKMTELIPLFKKAVI